MIHTIEIDSETEPKALKKLFRKRLMTGGAVIRLKSGLSEDELELIFETFERESVKNNLHSMVLRAVAEAQNVTGTIVNKFSNLQELGRC